MSGSMKSHETNRVGRDRVGIARPGGDVARGDVDGLEDARAPQVLVRRPARTRPWLPARGERARRVVAAAVRDGSRRRRRDDEERDDERDGVGRGRRGAEAPHPPGDCPSTQLRPRARFDAPAVAQAQHVAALLARPRAHAHAPISCLGSLELRGDASSVCQAAPSAGGANRRRAARCAPHLARRRRRRGGRRSSPCSVASSSAACAAPPSSSVSSVTSQQQPTRRATLPSTRSPRRACAACAPSRRAARCGGRR